MAGIGKIHTFERQDGRWDWRYLAGNGEEMCGSLQGYEDEQDAREAFLLVQLALRGSPEIEIVRLSQEG